MKQFYKIEYRLQDEGWRDYNLMVFDNIHEAEKCLKKLKSKKRTPVFNMMFRVSTITE